MASLSPQVESSSAAISPAQRLKEEHTAAEAHHPTVEDAVDEDDPMRPSPSSRQSRQSDSGSRSGLVDGAPESNNAPAKAAVIDTQSEELFPSLGGGSKARAGAVAAPSWGAKKTAPLSKPAANGTSNGISASSPISSRASTPTSGSFTPASRNATSRKAPMQMAMPGKHTDSITLVPAQMDKGKPIKSFLDKLNKKSRAKVTKHTARDGSSIVFEGSGPKKDVIEALRTIARELSAKQTKKFAVPTSCRAHIIGQGGSVVKDISARTGAKIQVPRSDSSPRAHDDDDFTTIDIEIEGDPYAVELARLEIDKLVSARTSTVNMRLKDIPPEFFPFLAGPHDTRIQALQQEKEIQIDIPQFYTWQHRPPPRAAHPDQPLDFQPHPDMHVKISGDRVAAQQARAQIERRVQELRRQLAVQDHAFQRGHHQFIVGERGMSPHEFLAETGCAVVLPPEHDDTEDIFIIGPPNKLQGGADRAAELAAEMQMANIDPRRHFADAPFGAEAHSRALSRYLQARKLEAEITKLFGAQVAFPPQSDPSVNWEIYSRDSKKSIQARAELTKIIQAHPPSRLAIIEIDPFFHPHLRRQCASNLRNDHGVNMILPRNGESSHVVLVYEASRDDRSPYQIPRQRPSDAEAAQFVEALRQAENHLISVVGQQPEVATRNVAVARKFHEKLRKFVEREQSQQGPQFPVELVLGGQKANTSWENSTPEGLVKLRGLAADVSDLESKIQGFTQEAEKDELERGYTTTFDFPAKFNGYLIGREGVKIRELRDQFDVEIKTLDDGKIEVQGPKAKADACKDHISGLRKKFEDEATYVLKIDPKFHGQLVGKKGSDVNRLQDKYNVKIQFPQSSHGHHEAQDVESVSDGGAKRGNRGNQAHDEVVIRGPRQGADKARTEVLDLYQYARDNSHTVTVSVPRQHLGSLIGQRGGEIERLRAETSAQIDLPDRQESNDPKAVADIAIRGTKQAVDAAKAEIQKKVKLLNDTVSSSIDIDRQYHGPLIGAQGANIRRLVIEAGGPEQSHQTVRFPERGSESSIIRVEGQQSLVTQVIAAIEKFVAGQKSQTSDTIEVPSDKHGQLIGPRGEAKRDFEQKYNVTMEIPKKGSNRTDIKVSGSAENVAKARETLSKLAEQRRESHAIDVPQHLHHVIAENGRFFARLKSDLGVIVDHGNSKLPAKPSGGPSRRPGANDVMPLITDDDSPDAHSWKVISAPGAEGGDGSTIPWILTGSSTEATGKAKDRLTRAIETASKPSATGHLRLSDPSCYRFVIGPGGRNINRIRDQTGCNIQVPNARNQKGDDLGAIEIVGTPDGCEAARELVLESVRNGSNRG